MFLSPAAGGLMTLTRRLLTTESLKTKAVTRPDTKRVLVELMGG
jgi:hypothetical protein